MIGSRPFWLLICAVLLLSGCTDRVADPSSAPTGVDERSAAGPEPSMPALSAHLSDLQDFYRFHFLPDGYPGRLDDDGKVFAHPIYGTYVLSDYIGQYEQRPTAELRAAIRKVADAIVNRMDDFKGSLVFWYEADPQRGQLLYKRHYSGLTQAKYAIRLARAGRILDDAKLMSAAEKVYRSLLIDHKNGGVYYESNRGPVIAEVPTEPNSWILNGWQSALVSMHEYAEFVDSDDARALVVRSAKTMSSVMSLYDDPTSKISRYALSAPLSLRLVFSHRPSKLDRVALSVPGEGLFPLPRLSGTTWQPAISPRDISKTGEPNSKKVALNAVVSLISSPAPNDLSMRVASSRSTTVRLEARVGPYDPVTGKQRELRWTKVAVKSVGAGTSRLTFSLSDRLIEGAVAPTNFSKKIDGEQVNIYHSVHINRLRMIADQTGVGSLNMWADKFAAYICQWPRNPAYAGLKVRSPETGAIVAPAAVC